MAIVTIINPTSVPAATVERIVGEATLPAGRVLLLLGDRLLTADYQALTIPRRHIRDAANLYGLEQQLQTEWDCGITIGEKWTSAQPSFPAYFAYLLGHELGHASTILQDPVTAAYEELITRYIRRATGGTPKLWHELPHERRYDQFGVAISVAIYGRDHFIADIRRVRQSGLTQDDERLVFLLELMPRKDLAGIRDDLASFTLPHKAELLLIWEGAKQVRDSAASAIADLGSLWSAS